MARWTNLLLQAALLITSAKSLCGDDADCQHAAATKFAPVLRLDKETLSQDRCLPGHPATVYYERKAGNQDVICESNLTKLEAGEVPLFYHYKECGSDVVVIDYFIWYSHQRECLKIEAGGLMNEAYGEHKADWETVAVQIQYDEVKRVGFHQHSGAYSKSPDQVTFVDSTHPVAYVGLDSHGSYHDEGGTGNCLYFQDYRRFDDKSLKLEGWKFLINAKNKSQDLPEWFDGSRDFYDGFPNPSNKGNACRTPSCSGVDSWIELTGVCTGTSCGCRKSDYCNDIEFGSVSGKKPCDDSLINDITNKGKDLGSRVIGGLRDSAQVSGATSLHLGFAVILVHLGRVL